MAYNDKILVCVLVCCFSQVWSFGSDLYSKPQILWGGDSATVYVNENHTFFCQGKNPLKWVTPKVEKQDEQKWTTFKIEHQKPNNTLFQYGLRLDIYNMSYPFVGFYECRYLESEGDYDDGKMDRKYLYVDDPNHLSVYASKHQFLQRYAVENQIAIIPCRPTSPDVNVTLKGGDGEELDDEENRIYTYDPFYGFITRSIVEGKMYQCKYQKGQRNGNHNIFLIVETPTKYVPTPTVTDENDGHNEVGDTIHLKCSVYAKTDVILSWQTPAPNDPIRMEKNDSMDSSTLTIRNATLKDKGTFWCNVSDHQNHHSAQSINIEVFEKGYSDIIIKEENDIYTTPANPGGQIQWTVEAWGHPQTTFEWIHELANGEYRTINNHTGSKKYEISRIGRKLTLKIKNINLSEDFGRYILHGENNRTKKNVNFFLNVTDKPTVKMSMKVFHLVGQPDIVKCEAAGHPKPVIHWQYKSCSGPECPFVEVMSNKTPSEEGLTVSSEISVTASERGRVKCIAKNSIGSDFEEEEYLVTDFPDGFAIEAFDDSVLIQNDTAIFAIGESIHASCRASSEKYREPVWLKNGKIIVNNYDHKIRQESTRFSNAAILDIDGIGYDKSGLYSCRVSTSPDNFIFRNMTFSVTDPKDAKITNSNMNGEEFLEFFPKSVTFRCMVEGIPKPRIAWYKNDIDFIPNDPRIRFEKDKQLLVFNSTDLQDQGSYKCLASNKGSSDSREVKLRFKNAPVMMQAWMIYIIVFLVFTLVVVMIYLIIRVRIEKKMKLEMKKLGLANFEKGAVENINPELGISDQAELLPYDRKWEFPIEQLKLGKQLGSGAFGVVLKGEAKHIVDGEPVTTVAVKMVKKNADHIYIRALASELKIMVHLGKHLNVVNLLGACTKNVAKKELLVIVEYCRYGNLQNFLLRHRSHFINQVDPNTGKVNYHIGQEELLDRTYSVSSSRSHTQSPLLKYAALVFSDSDKSAGLPTCNEMGDYRANNLTGATQMTTATQGEDGIVQSNNSIQPEWRSNYRGDYKENFKYIGTNDLIAWSFQIARGMEYLASRKVLHGDLAARNILLSDDNIVKICDFGLAKSMYQSENYKKSGDCPLPIKWMAIESIRDKLFSTQSDVWSFGIVLWEIFSLGRTPYPGMEADERLYHKLLNGYRMESPEYSPKEIYQIMTECWAVKPTSRPSFTKLTEKIGGLLEDTLRKYYIDLNDPYLAMNTKMLQEQSDYLAMINPPTFESVSSPHYVNDMVRVSPPPSEDGYMSMKPNTIFSPRLTEDGVFDFSGSTNRKNSNEEGNGAELLPMLHVKSDTDSPCPSPNAVSNPSYHVMPKIGLETKDNYVNMPENKNMLKLECESKVNVDRHVACT